MKRRGRWVTRFSAEADYPLKMYRLLLIVAHKFGHAMISNARKYGMTDWRYRVDQFVTTPRRRVRGSRGR